MFGIIMALLIFLAQASAQFNSSCVQVMDSAAAGASPYYPDDEPSLTFTMEGATNLKTNTVNVVLVVDGSLSIAADEFVLEQQFAKDTVEAFASRELFEKGGTASYVQFSGTTYDEGTFNSSQSFNAHVDSVVQTGVGTDIVEALSTGAALLNANASSFGFIVLVTDGESTVGDPVAAAEQIRADNTTIIFAVGVGSSISTETILGIAGTEDNVFSVSDFDSLAAAVADIEIIVDQTVLSCPATGVSITVEFDVAVGSVGSSGAASTGATISSDNRVTFTAEDLEGNPTQFAVGLERCGRVTSLDYDDDQGNSPDFSSLPDPTCNHPRPGRGAAILTSAVIVSTAVLAALANMVGGIASAGSSSPSIPRAARGGQNAIQQELREREEAKSSDNHASHGSPNNDSTVNFSRTRGAREDRNAARIQGAREDRDAEGNPSSQQGQNALHMEAVDDAPVGDGNGQESQVARLLVVGGVSSTRSPSSTLVWLMVVQAQFLAVLSLVDSVGSEASWLSSFLEYLRWLNFWVPIGADSEDDPSLSENDLNRGEFVGNTVMFWCIALLILVLHVLLVSAVEACWLQATKQRETMTEARTGFEEDSGPPRSWGGAVESAPASGGMTEPGVDPAGVRGAVNFQHDLEPVAKCRERSKSIWIHFPHVELVFLLYGVQGSLAAQLAVLRHGDGVVFYVGAIALVVYPIFLVGMICRVIFFRVRPEAGGITFTLTEKDRYYNTRGSGRGCQRFISRVLKGLKEEQSAFGWAQKGVWTTTDTGNVTDRRLGDWFRIGFEPLFADFTQSGSWFAAYALLESCTVACVGVLLDNSQSQLLIFMGLNSAGFLVVACFQPFANRVVNIIAASRVGLNAVCMALLVVAEAEDVAVHAERLETTVGILELLFILLGLALPVFVDTVTALVAAARRGMRRNAVTCCAARKDNTEAVGPAEDDDENASCCVIQGWRATWFRMIRRNSGAYIKDVANGLRRKPHSA